MTLEYPEDLKYLDSHEYVRIEDDEDIATIGLSAFALEELGDVVFLELPELGDAIASGDNIGTVESVKAVSEIYAPVSGTVVDRNEMLIEQPEAIADDPYGEGWLVKVRLDNSSEELEDALSAEEYRAMVEPEA
ncbi:glycine cleavage system protein GcvH [Cyanobacterium sp. IPPAS B-1200]|uniref:glycine cleavage system protein GcvH n=1 Tax=Cyanobacterium sp. IPPAS B-1200 TaxID=1562720 RepID=UPI0008528464|nr:glycine cleavage system protein GcvH [Cyanobacterium sp. IPPAS B-1200]OEJ77638.1 glycine cleavage system protein H [Cyanobacterium sp. IPPAS B-1200]